MRPQGFIGRDFPGRHPDLNLPSRINDWNDDHALVSIARRGEDSLGNLIIGEESFDRWTQGGQAIVVDQERVPAHYAELAERVGRGECLGSSVGGKQPKFSIRVDNPEGSRYVLVKYSPPVDSSAGRRWADLLVCEHLALEIINEAGMPAAVSSIFEAEGRTFLEVERFDRVGRGGRIGLLSLMSVAAEHADDIGDWASTTAALAVRRWLTAEEAERAAWLQAFGNWIGNSDMHLGNLSLLYEGGNSARLAPAYDMLPMRFAPNSQGEVRALEWSDPHPTPAVVSQWASARRAGHRFWARAAADSRLSQEFREFAAARVSAAAPWR